MGTIINVDRIMVAIIIGICWIVRFVIWDIAKAAPVLDFWNNINVKKEVETTNVLIDPNRIKNCSLDVFLKISEAKIAAWDEPSPGKREQMGDIKIVASVGFIIWDFGIVSFFVFWGGNIVLDFIECISVEVAKSPVKRGSSGWLTLEFKVANAKNPESKKIINAFIFGIMSCKRNKGKWYTNSRCRNYWWVLSFWLHMGWPERNNKIKSCFSW